MSINNLDSLDAGQKDILQQFRDVTHMEDVNDAIERLTKHDWNLERTVHILYESEESTETQRPSESTERQTSSSPVRSHDDHGTRRRSERPRRPQVPFWLFLVSWPFNMVWSITRAILSFTLNFVSKPAITSARHPPDPRPAHLRLLQSFEERYGSTHVPFLQHTYTEALDLARRQYRFLVVVLQSSEHDSMDPFCRYTLTSPELIQFVEEKRLLVWAGDVSDEEAYKVSDRLHATSYPFIAVIGLQTSPHATVGSAKMTVVSRVEGLVSPNDLMDKLNSVLERHSSTINRLRMEKDRIDEERRLRKEQERAYHESLAADREKERKAKEEREEAQRREEALARLEKQRKQYLHYLRKHLRAEPGSETPAKEVAKIRFQMEHGVAAQRTFHGDWPIETIYQFVQVYRSEKKGELDPVEQDTEADEACPPDYVHEYDFTITSTFPRFTLEPEPTESIHNKGLRGRLTLHVDEK